MLPQFVVINCEPSHLDAFWQTQEDSQRNFRTTAHTYSMLTLKCVGVCVRAYVCAGVWRDRTGAWEGSVGQSQGRCLATIGQDGNVTVTSLLPTQLISSTAPWMMLVCVKFLTDIEIWRCVIDRGLSKCPEMHPAYPEPLHKHGSKSGNVRKQVRSPERDCRNRNIQENVRNCPEITIFLYCDSGLFRTFPDRRAVVRFQRTIKT